MDLIMLSSHAGGGGRLRTAEEFRALLEASGPALAEIIPTASSISVPEARPARDRSGDEAAGRGSLGCT